MDPQPWFRRSMPLPGFSPNYPIPYSSITHQLGIDQVGCGGRMECLSTIVWQGS